MVKDCKKIAIAYAESVVSGKKVAGKEIVMACQRFLDDLKRDDLEYNAHDPDFVANIIERHIIHKQGQDINGESLVGKPLILQPWQVFVICNLI